MRVESGGNVFELGETETTPTITLTDYSRRSTDDYGITTVVERGFSRKLSTRFQLEFGQVDLLQRRLSALRATAALWVADDRFACLAVNGFFSDFEIDLNFPPVSYCTLTVEGLTVTEPWADTGSEPGTSGPSTMRLLRPVEITDLVLTSSSIDENDYVEWSAADSYATGARARRAHHVWESLIDSNHGNDPTVAASTVWVDAGPTNRWAMFDEALGSAATATGSIIVTLKPGVPVNAVAIIDTNAVSVRVQAPGYDHTLAVDGTALNFLDLHAAADAEIRITIAASGPDVSVSAGTLLVGPLLGLGTTEASPTAGITDYSRKDTDDFGEVTVVERAWAKRMAANTLISTASIDDVFSRLASVRARPSLWIAQDGVEALTIYGFYKDFSIEVAENVSKLSLTIEGLSTATTVLPPIPVTVAWPDIADTDPAHPKPADGATNTRNPSTPVGTGGATVADLLAGTGVIDNDPPAIPTGLITDGGTLLGDGSVDLMFGWNANTDSDLDGYVLGVAFNGGVEVQFSAPSNRFTFHALPPNTAYAARVRARDRFGNSSVFSAPVSGHTVKDQTPPGPPTDLSATATLGTIILKWVAPTDADVAHIRVYEAPSNNFASAALIGTLNAEPGLAGGTIRSVGTGGQRYYWVTALDTSENESVKAGPVTATALQVNTSDLVDQILNSSRFFGPGVITAPAIAVGAVRASAIAVVADNLNPDPQLVDPALWYTYRHNAAGDVNNPPDGWYREVAALSPGGAATMGLPNWIALWSGLPGMDLSARYHFLMGDPALRVVQVSGGKSYELSAEFDQFSNQNINVLMALFGLNASTGALEYKNYGAAVTAAANANGHSFQRIAFTAPTDAMWAQIIVYNEGQVYGSPSAFSGVARVSNVQIREQNAGTMVVDGTITSQKIVFNQGFADAFFANTLTVTNSFAAKVINSVDSLPGFLNVTGTGFTLGTLAAKANDPAATIRSNGTYITPGNILLTGGGYLTNMLTADQTRIIGGYISTNSIDVTKVTIGVRGVELLGIAFDTNRVNTVSWSAGYVDWYDEAGNRQVAFINAGSCFRTTNTSQVVYVWFDRVASPQTQGFYAAETTPAEIMANPNNVIVASYFGGTVLNVGYGQTIVDGGNIKTQTIDAWRVVVNGSITTPLLAAGAVTADKISVGTLSALTANIGLLRTADSGQRMELDNNSLRSYDWNNVMRVRVGVW